MNDARRGKWALAWGLAYSLPRRLPSRLQCRLPRGPSWRLARSLTWSLAWFGVVLGLGCSDGQKSYAEDTVRLTSRALLDVGTHVETSGDESPEVGTALRNAHDWLSPTEAALEMWAEGGDAAYERVAPCALAANGCQLLSGRVNRARTGLAADPLGSTRCAR